MKSNRNIGIGEYRLDLDDLLDLWQSHEDDITVNLTTGEAYYHDRLIVDPDEDGNWQPKGVLEWMGMKQYWPNVWLVNDHGNVELVGVQNDGSVTYHGGLV